MGARSDRTLARPIGGMLIFDGDCGSCTWAANWVRRRLPPEAVVQPWQWISDLDAYGLTREEVSSAAYWIAPDARAHRGPTAVAASLRAIGGGWRVLGIILSVPPMGWMLGAAYWIVARNRHRLPGSTPACRLPGKPGSA